MEDGAMRVYLIIIHVRITLLCGLWQPVNLTALYTSLKITFNCHRVRSRNFFELKQILELVDDRFAFFYWALLRQIFLYRFWHAVHDSYLFKLFLGWILEILLIDFNLHFHFRLFINRRISFLSVQSLVSLEWKLLLACNFSLLIHFFFDLFILTNEFVSWAVQRLFLF